jgi:hypothetical protein
VAERSGETGEIPLLEMRKRKVLCPDRGAVIELLFLGNMCESSLGRQITLGNNCDPAERIPVHAMRCSSLLTAAGALFCRD